MYLASKRFGTCLVLVAQGGEAQKRHSTVTAVPAAVTISMEPLPPTVS